MYMLPRGIDCIYPKPRDNESANHSLSTSNIPVVYIFILLYFLPKRNSTWSY